MSVSVQRNGVTERAKVLRTDNSGGGNQGGNTGGGKWIVVHITVCASHVIIGFHLVTNSSVVLEKLVKVFDGAVRRMKNITLVLALVPK